jgi:hypothetical protein
LYINYLLAREFSQYELQSPVQTLCMQLKYMCANVNRAGLVPRVRLQRQVLSQHQAQGQWWLRNMVQRTTGAAVCANSHMVNCCRCSRHCTLLYACLLAYVSRHAYHEFTHLHIHTHTHIYLHTYISFIKHSICETLRRILVSAFLLSVMLLTYL